MTISQELREAFEKLLGTEEKGVWLYQGGALNAPQIERILSFIAEREVLARKEERETIHQAIENWTPKKVRQLEAGGGRVAPTLDDYKRNFSQEILALLTPDNKQEI